MPRSTGRMGMRWSGGRRQDAIWGYPGVQAFACRLWLLPMVENQGVDLMYGRYGNVDLEFVGGSSGGGSSVLPVGLADAKKP